MISPLVLLAAVSAMSAGHAPELFLSGPPAWRPRLRMPTKPRRADPNKKTRRKARQAAQRRNRRTK